MSGMVNASFILDMQVKLYRWSTSEKTKTFSDLFNLICDRRTLVEAWIRLSQNRGSQTPGTDGVTRRKIEEQAGGVGRFLDEVHNELRSGTFRPEPVRQRFIPKSGRPGQFRPLGIPTLKDRLVQMAIKFVLEPIFEADFYPNSYGFRRGRSTHDALAAVKKQLQPTSHGPSMTHYVIEGDIKGCFDSINHHLLMEQVKRRITDRKVLLLIRSFLKAGIMIEGSLKHNATGTPQGGVLSPLLANIFLHKLDERYDRWMPRPREKPTNAAGRRRFDRRHKLPTFYMVRYADDFVLLVVGSRRQAEIEREALATFLWEEMRLELSMEKTRITRPENGFVFLGYRVARTKSLKNGNMVGNLFIPNEKAKDLRRKIKKMTSRATLVLSFGELIQRLNPLITGWRNYFKYATGAYRVFSMLDNWLWHRIDRWLQRKHQNTGARKVRSRYRAGPHPPMRNRWRDGKSITRTFSDGGTRRYTNRGTQIPNGWNDEELGEGYALQGDPGFWRAYHALEVM